MPAKIDSDDLQNPGEQQEHAADNTGKERIEPIHFVELPVACGGMQTPIVKNQSTNAGNRAEPLQYDEQV